MTKRDMATVVQDGILKVVVVKGRPNSYDYLRDASGKPAVAGETTGN